MYRKTIGEPHRYIAKKLSRRRQNFWSAYRRMVIGVVGSGVVVIVIYVITNMILYAPKYIISNVSVSHNISSATDTDVITEYIQQIVGGHDSYLTLRLGERKNDQQMIMDTFPLIESVEMTGFDENTIQIYVSYHEPHIVRHLPNGSEFGSYNEYLYPLSNEYTPSDSVALLYLPSYLSTLTSLEGIYHETPETELVKIYHTVNTKIPLQHMIVYPGAGYVAMKTVDDLKVLFSLRKPIEDQMNLYSTIYQNYDEAHRIRQIDVGSLDDAIVTLE